MTFRNFSLLILFVAAFRPASAQRLNALFLGNSYTVVNNLPQMTTDVALSAGDTLTTQSNAPGGVTLQSHSTDATSLALIARGGYDYVVLQEQSQLPAFPDAQVATDVYPYARRLDSLIQVAGACIETVFYRTWGRQNGDGSNCASFPPICTYAGMDSLLARRYRIMADSNRALLSPVGQVWKALRQRNPAIALYQADESHPTVAGSYAAACTFYTIFFRKSPLRISSNQALPAADALAIRQAVKTVVFDSLLYWNVGRYDPRAQFAFTVGSGRRVTFRNSSLNAVGYSWQFGTGQGSDTAANPAYTFTANGTYTVRLIARRCGRADTLTQQVTVSATSVSGVAGLPEVQVFPNPAGSVLRVTGLPQAATVDVLDVQGKPIALNSYWDGSQRVLATGALPAGLYTLRIQSATGTESRLFRKE